MSANPIDPNTTPKTTGSLEELFRHHLAEAAVPPPPQLWEHIDNSLLVRQNEVYRRRLAATRWVAAASLLLATVAGGGWWAQRAAVPGGAEVAAALRQPGGSAPTAATPTASRRSQPAASEVAARPAATTRATANTDEVASRNSASARLANPRSAVSNTYAANVPNVADQEDRPGLGRRQEAAPAVGHQTGTRRMPAGVGVLSVASSARQGEAGLLAAPGELNARQRQRGSAARSASGLALAAASGNGNGLRHQATSAGQVAQHILVGPTAGTMTSAAGGSGTGQPEDLPTMLASRPGNGRLAGADSLQLRLALLQLPAPDALALSLTPLPLAETPEPMPARSWQLGASYAVGSFNPNVNFGRPGSPPNFDYNPALGINSPALSEQAAAEYRTNLRAGLSQRLSLRATRQLKGAWSLGTGAEFTESHASSATSFIFVGEQVPDFGQLLSEPLRTTRFRYRLASVPVELRYANPAKRGWSVYGRLGTVVSALLGVRAEVEGFTEATREYAITSPGPYRRVLADVRGGAGAQFRPATRSWAITLGPVAQAGVLSLNNDPAEGFWGQHRSYSFGLEAGVEFGR